MQTSRITSGFDVELQLGASWFRTAVELLVEKGVIDAGGLPIIITGMSVILDPDWDLEMDVLGLPAPVRVRADLNDDGTELTLTTDNPGIPPQVVPFGALDQLAEPPVKVKLAGDAGHQNTIAILANLDIHAEPQSGEPDDEIVARGDPSAAQSFLETGQHVAFGLGADTFQRFANDIWHTELRAEDGSHPLPDEDHKRGSWSRVTGRTTNSGAIQFVLEGDIPLDSPLIDVVPDPHVEITLTLDVSIDQGQLSFTIDTETDVDTGLLGDLFGGLVGAVAGAIIGLILGLFTGGILLGVLIGAGVGFVVGVIAVEVAEYVVEGIVQREIKARIDGEPLPDILCCEDGVVQIATPASDEDSFDLALLDSLPSSIAIHDENPEGEWLYRQHLLVSTAYEDLAVKSDGFGAAGSSGTVELFEPEVVTIASFDYDDTDELVSITYQRDGGQTQTLALSEVLDRVGERAVQPPFRLITRPDEADLHQPSGKIATVCLTPARIRRRDTVIDEFEFGNGARLRVADAVALQDAGAIVLPGYQLIHPRNANPYFRSPADSSTSNNLESLPQFA